MLSSTIERVPLLPLLALGLAATAAAVVGPEALTAVLLLGGGALIIATRPAWGVAAILVMLMVQYGSRRYERGGIAGLLDLIPAGSGLVTVNNVLGLFLALLLVYHVYRDGDWSFLRSRQLQLVALITAVLAFSAFVSGLDAADAIDLGLRLTGGQDPTRLLVSRALFLVLFVFFLREPRDLRMIVGVFVVLAVATAWSGSEAAITGSGRPEVADYRAGGVDVLIGATQNPNRLALTSTLALIFIWEYSQANTLHRWRWLAGASVLLLVITVFLSASRGGVLGLAFAAMLLFVRRRTGGSSRLLYGAAIVVLGVTLIGQVVPEEALERLANIPGVSESAGEGTGSIERRGYTYGVGLDIWMNAPLVGIGPGNWPYVRFITDPLRSAAAPHNSFLKALAEGGILTFGLYLLLFATSIRALLRCERSPAVMAAAQRDGLGWLVPATRIALVTFLVFSLFADLWDLVFAYLLIGVTAVLLRRYEPLSGAAPQPV